MKIKDLETNKVVFEGGNNDFLSFVKSLIIAHGDLDFSVLGISDAREYIEDYCSDLEVVEYTEYQFFMFTQILILHLAAFGTNDEVHLEPYDILYSVFKQELEKYLESEYNNEKQSEHDCMVDYILDHLDTISITIADHCNI